MHIAFTINIIYRIIILQYSLNSLKYIYSGVYNNKEFFSYNKERSDSMKTIKLLAVTGYYQEGNNFDFVEEKSWKGTALLREDLTFEGIVVDNSATSNFDRLISGTLVEYNGTSLIKFSNHGLLPCSFFGMSNGKEIIGNWAVHSYLSTYDAGRSKIIFTEIPMDESTVTDITSRIEAFKEEMDSFSERLYNSLIEHMSLTIEVFIQNLEENKLNIESEIGCTLKKLEF